MELGMEEERRVCGCDSISNKAKAKEKEIILLQCLKLGPKGVLTKESVSDFYRVDLKKGKVSIHLSSLSDDCHFTVPVSLGSVVYAIGGGGSFPGGERDQRRRYGAINFQRPPLHRHNHHHHVHNGASCLELTCPEDEYCQWKGAPPPKERRHVPICASISGKIYAFGGSASFAEVFDPVLGNWEFLDPPHHEDFEISCPVLRDSLNNRLLMHFVNISALYAYYPNRNNKGLPRWVCIDPNFPGWNPQKVPADTVVDNVLYFYVHSPQCIAAYDLSTKRWLKVKGCSSFANVGITYFEAMVYLGNGMLCLAYHKLVFDNPEATKMSIQFVKFKAQRTSPGEVLVNFVSDQSFLIDPCIQITSFLPL